MKIIFILAILVFIAIFRIKTNDCFIMDQNVYVKSINIENKSYFLYKQTNGWHDKISFFVLYKNKPEWDDCGRIDLEPVSIIEIVDRNQKTPLVYVKDYKLIINYKVSI